MQEEEEEVKARLIEPCKCVADEPLDGMRAGAGGVSRSGDHGRLQEAARLGLEQYTVRSLV